MPIVVIAPAAWIPANVEVIEPIASARMSGSSPSSWWSAVRISASSAAMSRDPHGARAPPLDLAAQARNPLGAQRVAAVAPQLAQHRVDQRRQVARELGEGHAPELAQGASRERAQDPALDQLLPLSSDLRERALEPRWPAG